jgi:hypothetical protein
MRKLRHLKISLIGNNKDEHSEEFKDEYSSSVVYSVD